MRPSDPLEAPLSIPPPVPITLICMSLCLGPSFCFPCSVTESLRASGDQNPHFAFAYLSRKPSADSRSKQRDMQLPGEFRQINNLLTLVC